MRRLTIIISALLALAAVAAVTRAGDGSAAVTGAAAGEPGDGITVQGNGAVSAVPDRAQISFGVETRAATAKAALSGNAAEMRKVIAAVKAAGATDVQTQSVSLQPQYAEAGAVQGYIAQNSVSGTIRDLAKAGAVIDAAVDAGANQVYGPSLSRGDQAELYRQALRAAVADARTRAQALASAANLTLGRVTQVVEGGSAPMPFANALKAGDAAGTPIEAGTQQIVASVQVTFSVS